MKEAFTLDAFIAQLKDDVEFEEFIKIEKVERMIVLAWLRSKMEMVYDKAISEKGES